MNHTICNTVLESVTTISKIALPCLEAAWQEDAGTEALKRAHEITLHHREHITRSKIPNPGLFSCQISSFAHNVLDLQPSSLDFRLRFFLFNLYNFFTE